MRAGSSNIHISNLAGRLPDQLSWLAVHILHAVASSYCAMSQVEITVRGQLALSDAERDAIICIQSLFSLQYRKFCISCTMES
jgi:hypothetical protein